MGKYFWHDTDGVCKDWRWEKHPHHDNWWVLYLDKDYVAMIANDGSTFSAIACGMPFPVDGFATRRAAALFALQLRKHKGERNEQE